MGTGETVGVVFIQGAGLSSRIWNTVAVDLDRPYLLIDFPKRNDPQSNGRQLTLKDYVSHIRKQIEAWEVKRFVVVAHSLGGILGLGIADEMEDHVAGFVAVGAVIPKKGGSFLSVMPFPKRVLMYAVLRVLGTKPPESAIRHGLCHDLSPDQASEIVSHFVPESYRVYVDRVESPVPDVPKLYIKLEEDRELSPSAQDKMIGHLSPQYLDTLQTGHLPMLSQPSQVILALNTFLYYIEAG